MVELGLVDAICQSIFVRCGAFKSKETVYVREMGIHLLSTAIIYILAHVSTSRWMECREIKRKTARDVWPRWILPVTAAEIAEGSILVKVYKFASSGWPGSCPGPELKPFWNRGHEISLETGCQLWGRRVIVPFLPFWKSYIECRSEMCRLCDDLELTLTSGS